MLRTTRRSWIWTRLPSLPAWWHPCQCQTSSAAQLASRCGARGTRPGEWRWHRARPRQQHTQLLQCHLWRKGRHGTDGASQQEHPHWVCLSKGASKSQPPLPASGKNQSHMSEWANSKMKTLSCTKGILRTSRLPFRRYSAISSRIHLPLKGTGLSASSHHLSSSHQELDLKIHFDWRAFTSVLNVLKF